MTYDVDVLVTIDDADWTRFIRAAERCGFQPRGSDALDFARESRMLLMRHRPSAMDVDVMLAAIALEREIVSRRRSIVVRRLAIPVPSPEDLIILKAIAQRPRDLMDIDGILEKHPRLDKRRIRRVLSEFAEALDAPDILHELDRLIERHTKKRKE
jgi:Nucleotidyl transferase of unknown function (DUF2204)